MPRGRASEKELEANRAMGRRLRKLRLKAELSMEELAERMRRLTGKSQFNRQSIYDWEWTDEKEGSGRRPAGIPGGMVPYLASALGVEVEELMGEAAGPLSNPHVLAVERLTKKLSNWRLQELSLVPEGPLVKGVDAIIADHKGSPAGTRQRRKSQRS